MSRSNPGHRRIAALLAGLVVVAGFALAAPAQAVQDTDTRRLAGTDRFGTAAAVALETYPTGATNVVLATGGDFADALAASGLAGALDAPVLLTGRDTLPAATGDALNQLNPTTVYLMGGEAAVSAAVQQLLVDGGYTVQRIQGADRFATAAAAGDAIAASTAGVGETGNGTTAVLANGRNFPDAVSISPVAFAGHVPVLLSESGSLPTATADALTRLGIEHVVILGGPVAVSNTIQSSLEDQGFTTQRLEGSNRYATNTAVARYAQDEFDFVGPTAMLATGENFPDALAGSAFGGKTRSVLILTTTGALAGPAAAFFAEFAAAYDEIVALGGTAAVADVTLTAAATSTKLESLQSFDVTPAESAALPPSSGGVASDNAGVRTYTVAGLDPATAYVIALLDAEVVDVDASTISSYSVTTTAATVNGGTAQETATSTAEGTLQFTIDGTEHDAVVPVVYLDADADGVLDLADGVPTELFGLGGRTTWIPAEAADGLYDGDPLNPTDGLDQVTVTSLDRDANFFVVDGIGTFYYSTGDVFQVGDTVINFNQFEGMITVGDILHPHYFANQQSLFKVVDDEQSDLTGLQAASVAVANGGDSVTVSWDPTDQPDAKYVVHRDFDRDGVLDDTDPKLTETTNTSYTFVEATLGTVQYIVRPLGGVSGMERFRLVPGFPTSTRTGYFFSNEVRVGDGLIGLTNGSAVAVNAGLAVANQNDVWMLHFSKSVKFTSGASITVGGVTYANGTGRSTWTVDGSAISITLGPDANSTTFAYPGTITALTGVSDLGGTAVSLSNLRDKTLENDAVPELMLESSTCNTGDSVCTLTFNQPVSAQADDTTNYQYTGVNSFDSVVRGANQRTITLTFGDGLGGRGSLGASDTIAPYVAIAPPGTDVDNSRQPLFDFVL